MTCITPGCTEINIKANGLCNPHYMLWYREQRQELEREVRRALTKFGQPSDYYCESDSVGLADCRETPVRWWVKDGGEPLALCHTHTEEILAIYRREVRRLELKV